MQAGGLMRTPEIGPESQAIDGLRERKTARARAATVDAGFRLFAERGYDQVTVADICTAAEIGRRTFFHYFPGKEDLLDTPVRDLTAHLAGALGQAPPEVTDGHALRGALAELARYALADRDRLKLYRRIIHTSTTLRLPAFWNLPRHELRLAQQLQARHSAAGPVDLDTRLLAARAITAFRLWLDVMLESPPSVAHHHGEDVAAARQLFDRIFDADPLLAA
jgi:AcrR family transcriptional regulator